MTAHQRRKLTGAELMKMRDRFEIPFVGRSGASTSISTARRRIRRR